MYNFAGYNELGYLILIKETIVTITGATGSGIKRKKPKARKRKKTKLVNITGTTAFTSKKDLNLVGSTAHSKLTNISCLANTYLLIESKFKYISAVLGKSIEWPSNIFGNTGYTKESNQLIESVNCSHKEQDCYIDTVDSSDNEYAINLSAIGCTNIINTGFIKANTSKEKTTFTTLSWKTNIVSLKDILMMEI